MSWLCENAHEVFSQYRAHWDAINQTCGNHILLDSRFVEPLLRCFGSRDVLLVVSTEARRGGMALVRRRRMGAWETFQPGQAPLGLLVLEPGADGVEWTQALMKSLPGHALALCVYQQDPDVTRFTDWEQHSIEIVEYIDTPRLTLSSSFADYWQAQGKTLEHVHQFSKRSRRLARSDLQLGLRIDRDPCRVAECVEQHGRLEQSGWKGRAGTALTADNPQGTFYRSMLENFCERNEGVMYRLFFNDETVASQLALERDGALIFLKTAYDERFKEFAPGFLLQLEILKILHAEQRVKRIEFYGRVREWHARWRAETRTMYHVNVYGNKWIGLGRRFLKTRLHL